MVGCGSGPIVIPNLIFQAVTVIIFKVKQILKSFRKFLKLRVSSSAFKAEIGELAIVRRKVNGNGVSRNSYISVPRGNVVNWTILTQVYSKICTSICNSYLKRCSSRVINKIIDEIWGQISCAIIAAFYRNVINSSTGRVVQISINLLLRPKNQNILVISRRNPLKSSPRCIS